MDLGTSLDSGAGRVPLVATTDSVEQPGTGCVGSRGNHGGARQRVPLRGQILGPLCRPTTAQPDYQSEQGHAVHAQAGAGTGHLGCILHRARAAQQDRTMAVTAVSGGTDQLHPCSTRRPLAFAIRLRPPGPGTIDGAKTGTNRPADQPLRLVCGAGDHRLFRSATHRAGVSRTQGWGLAGMGTDVSLDRPEDPLPCLLLHVGNLAVAVCTPPGCGSMARALYRRTNGTVTPDSEIHTALSATGRKRAKSCGHRSF